MTLPPILILHATGTNRDREAAWACELAGGAPEIVHVNRLFAGEVRLADYHMIVIPGGFSYGDDLGAGKLWAVNLRHRLADALAEFATTGRPILGICNGFQVLVKAGLLPGDNQASGIRHQESDSLLSPVSCLPSPAVTLTRNDSARFECRWVTLEPQAESPCIFTRELTTTVYCPVAHGEGKFVTASPAVLATIEAAGLVALRYVQPGLEPGCEPGYPWNPNGSQNAIAGICNPQGNNLGLMPHPEDHIIPEQRPGYRRGATGNLGLPLFNNGIRYAAAL